MINDWASQTRGCVFEWSGKSDQQGGETPSWEARELNKDEPRTELSKLGTAVCNQVVSAEGALAEVASADVALAEVALVDAALAEVVLYEESSLVKSWNDNW